VIRRRSDTKDEILTPRVKYEEQAVATLEENAYRTEETFADPAFEEKMVRFCAAASMKGLENTPSTKS